MTEICKRFSVSARPIPKRQKLVSVSFKKKRNFGQREDVDRRFWFPLLFRIILLKNVSNVKFLNIFQTYHNIAEQSNSSNKSQRIQVKFKYLSQSQINYKQIHKYRYILVFELIKQIKTMHIIYNCSFDNMFVNYISKCDLFE